MSFSAEVGQAKPLTRQTWIGTTAAVAAIGSSVGAIYPSIGLLIVPAVSGLVLLRFRKQRFLLVIVTITALGSGYFVGGWGHAAYALMGILLPGLIIAETRIRGYGLPTALILGVLPPVLAVLIFREYFLTLFELFVLALENTAASPEFSAFYSGQQAEQVLQLLTWWTQHAVYYLPAVTLTMIATYYFIGGLIGEYFIVRSGIYIKRVPSFAHWKGSEWLIVALGVAAIMILSGMHWLEVIGWNCLIVLLVLFSVFGISLLEFYMRRAHLALGVRILVYLVLFILQFIAGVLLPLAALFDAKYDFRKIRAKRFG